MPVVDGIGGPSSFRAGFEAALRKHAISITHDPDSGADAILVIAGTRQLVALRKAARRGVRIVQRLDGMNWVHRRKWTGLRHFLRAEYGNIVLGYIRSRIAVHTVYQSTFSKDWWESCFGATTSSSVVHNGVDLEVFAPGPAPSGTIRVLVVEGSHGGGYDMGLDNAVELVRQLNAQGVPCELAVAGKISDAHQARVQASAGISIQWLGVVSHTQIPQTHRSAQILFSADLNPACPNAVIEALACGTPVVAFDTGAVKELVVGDAGKVVPYGGNPWNMDKPDVPALVRATREILTDRARFSTAARLHAERALGVDGMAEGYLRALSGTAS